MKMATWQVGLSTLILGIVLEHIFSMGPWHANRSAGDSSKNKFCLSFTAINFTSESNSVTPVVLVFSVSMGTCVFMIWNMLNAASVAEIMTLM